jgi:hypothetical protein
MGQRFIRFKERDIILEFYGLRPYTTHYFYFDKVKVTDMVKQFGKKLGQPLISDESGNLKIIFYLSSGISSDSYESIPTKVNNLKAGRKEVVVTTINSTVLPDNYSLSSTSYCASILGLDKVI